jgi:hypothetical protein
MAGNGEMSDDRLMEEVQRLQALLAEASEVASRIGVLCRREGQGALAANALSGHLAVATKATAGVATAQLLRRRSIRPVPGQPASGAVPESRREGQAPTAEERARALSAEVSRDGRMLSVTARDKAELTARVAWWAGRARALLGELGDSEWKTRELVERVYGDLFELARRYDLEGIEALDRRWGMDDFGIYCAYQRHLVEGTPLELSEKEQQTLWNALLRALLLPGRRVSPQKASHVLASAASSLGSDHPLVMEARVLYAERLTRTSKSNPPPSLSAPPASTRSADSSRTPASTRTPASARAPVSTRFAVSGRSPESARAPESTRPPASRPGVAAAIAVTRGRRTLLVGGNYADPTQQSAIQQQFKFSKFKWLTATSGSPESLARLAAAIDPDSYDVVFLLPGSEARELSGVIAACEDAAIPMVRLSSDYDETIFAKSALEFFG